VSRFFWKERRSDKRLKDAVLAKEIPRDDDRRGPAPPPPRTAHAPGVSVHRFGDEAAPNCRRINSGEEAGDFLEGNKGTAVALLLLQGHLEGAQGVLSGGDVLVSTASELQALRNPGVEPALLTFVEISSKVPVRTHHIRRDGLTGTAVPGITGLRTLARLPEVGLAVLRLGPPPGARWVFKGVTAIAVFSGRLAAFDGDDVKEIRALSFARVADPTATLYLEAGNDSALAVAFAADSFVAALS
jgi:hypothetical protein